MPNYVKYSTNTQTRALKMGNFWLGPVNDGKGPTSLTGYYTALNPPSGGFTIYANKVSNGPAIFQASNESQLVSITNQLGGTSFTTSAQCLTWYVTQTDKFCVNREYEGIVTNGLVYSVDAGFVPSYPTSGTSWYDLGPNGNTGTLTNSPSFNTSNGGVITFDGTDDYSLISNTSLLTFGTNPFSIGFWIYPTHTTLPTYRTILSNYNTYNNDFNTYFYLGIFTNNTIAFLDSTGNFITNFGFVLTTNIWTYVTFTRNGNSLICYKNGALQNSTSLGNNYSGTRTTKIGGGVGETATFQGNMSTMSIYNRALSATEVLQNYNAQKGRFGL